MSKLNFIIVTFLGSIAILHHLFKIVYLLFEPKMFERFKSISNKNLSKWQLLLYYTITIFFLIIAIRETMKL